MTKEEIKTLCEADGQLQWWAMALFAEIAVLIDSERRGYTPQETHPLIASKVKDFERIVIGRALDKAKEAMSLEDRVKRLEEKVGI